MGYLDIYVLTDSSLFLFPEVLHVSRCRASWSFKTAVSAARVEYDARECRVAVAWWHPSLMPCYHPMPAFRTESGSVVMGRPRARHKAARFFAVPCGTCVGCRQARARDWTVRCLLEAASHDAQCWSTLTYDAEHLPPTLVKGHLSGFLKRLRARLAPRRIRFFASGEYGEKRGRPHYHSILFGVSEGEVRELRASWPYGHADTHTLTPAGIAYVAGYTAKKCAQWYEKRERVDPDTGEVYVFQPPFLLMSRGGRSGKGIGSGALQYWRSWRRTAVIKGREVPVPRYLHASWLERADAVAIADLECEKEQAVLARDVSRARLEASEMIANAKLLVSHAMRQL